MLIPAIEGTKSILSSAKSQPTVKRVVLTSSIASVMDFDRHNEIGLTFTSADWNPVTYEQAKVSNPVVAYNGAKKYAELAAWDFIKNEGPQFDLVTICPPMVFGPMVHPVSKLSEINGSTGLIWQVASGTDPWPTAPLTAWVDVRDLAVAHVEALLRPDAGNQRFVISSPQKFTYQRIADILRQEFAWAREEVTKGDEGAPIPRGSSVDGETAAKVLGIGYRGFKECMLETVPQLKKLQGKDNLDVTI